MENNPISRLSAIPIYFVISNPRSGTTLLQAMLNTHPSIVAPPESKFIIRLSLRFAKIKLWNEKVIERFCNELFEEKLFTEYWGIDKGRLFSSLVEIKDNLNYQLACKMVFSQSGKCKDAILFVDKNPIYYFYLPELQKLFPEAKFIHMVRDYRPYIVSRRRVTNGRLSVLNLAYRWVKVNSLIEKIKEASPDKWLTVKYELLVTKPEVTIKQVCDFLGVPYNKEMVESHSKNLFPSFYDKRESAVIGKYHAKLFQPVTVNYVDDWKSLLKGHDLEVAEYIAGEFGLKEYGYEGTLKIKNTPVGKPVILNAAFKFFLVKMYLTKALKINFIYWIHKKAIRHLL